MVAVVCAEGGQAKTTSRDAGLRSRSAEAPLTFQEAD